jgi:hypothetical protein
MVSLVALEEQGTGFWLADTDEGAAAEGACEAAVALAEGAVAEVAPAEVAAAVLAAAELVAPPAAGVELVPPHAVSAVAATRTTASDERLLTSGRRPGTGAAPRDRFIATSGSVGVSRVRC